MAQNRVDFACDTVDIVGTLHSWRNSQKQSVSEKGVIFSYSWVLVEASEIDGKYKRNRMGKGDEAIVIMVMRVGSRDHKQRTHKVNQGYISTISKQQSGIPQI